MTREIALTWQIGTNFGWGLFGLQIALQLMASKRIKTTLLSRMVRHDGDPIERELLEEIWRHNRGHLQKMWATRTPGSRVNLHVPVVTALGNNAHRQFVNPSFDYHGTENHGLVFLENPSITDKALETFNCFDTLTAGSSWARDVLQARGVARTGCCIQGVDLGLFHPAPRSGYLEDRFVIFSGGKLEFRKGQDIVLKAVSRFRERHPETLLIGLWGNLWLGGSFVELMRHSPHYPNFLNHVGETQIDWAGLIDAAGLTDDDAKVYDTVENRALPILMRQADVALFPNRCEGGTNMMAMQAMACGVPSILSANTGHLDIIEDGACLPLTRQQPISLGDAKISTEGWGESDIDEIVDALETVYQDRKTARQIGAAGAELMARYSWEAQIAELAPLIGL